MPHPKGLVLRDMEGGKIVKYPVVFDDVPEQIQGFMNYLDVWQEGKLPGD